MTSRDGVPFHFLSYFNPNICWFPQVLDGMTDLSEGHVGMLSFSFVQVRAPPQVTFGLILLS